MNKLLTLFVSATLGLVLSASTAFAAGTSCQPIYGGGQSCAQGSNLVINKTVLNPQTNTFVDNLGVNDPKYSPDQIVTFQIIVTNNGGSSIATVNVKDILPQFVSFVSGGGNFNSANNTLSFDLSNLNTGESRTFAVAGKVASAGNLPANQGITCVINQAIATSSDNQTAQDNAQFCIQTQAAGAVAPTTKGGLKVFPAPQATTTPSTGPEAAVLFALLPTGALGYIMRKKAALS